MDALQDYNVKIVRGKTMATVTNPGYPVWKWIDPDTSSRRPRTNLDELLSEDLPRLDFIVRYQLEVCISNDCLNEYNITREFVLKLLDLPAPKAVELLEHVASQKRRFYEPMDIFKIKLIRGTVSRIRIPKFCVLNRSATITPSTIHFCEPSVEISNRVIRQYSEYSDRFLRVRFSDERYLVSFFLIAVRVSRLIWRFFCRARSFLGKITVTRKFSSASHKL